MSDVGFVEQISLLNKDADNRSVLDSIDRPIRPLVLELNRIGIHTRFSCCGYTYEGEEEPKSHHNTFTYVMFTGPCLKNPDEVETFFKVVHLFKSKGWSVQLAGDSQPNPMQQEWHVGFVPISMWKTDTQGNSMHDYEARLFAIVNMVKDLKFFPSASGDKEIVDGNISRMSVTPEWRVKPKKSYKIGFEC